jgi:hypothetical protein
MVIASVFVGIRLYHRLLPWLRGRKKTFSLSASRREEIVFI